MVYFYFTRMLQKSTTTPKNSNDGGPEFAEVFVIYWAGAFIVTLNIKLLGGTISFFQSVCVLGYCVLPLFVSLIICKVLQITLGELSAPIVKGVTILVAFIWSTFGKTFNIISLIKVVIFGTYCISTASTAFLAESQPPRRKALAVYPIFLFYFVISWLVFFHN